MKLQQKVPVCILLSAFLACFLFICHGQAGAQNQIEWSDPQLIFEDRDGFSRLDYMIADHFGQLHLFWSHNPQDPYVNEETFNQQDTVVFYQSLIENEWSIANDILLYNQAHLMFGAQVDGDGMLHVVSSFGGPPCLGYLQVPVIETQQPQSWTKPICLDDIGVGEPDLAIEPKTNTLYVLYPHRDQQEISLLISSDGGNTWSVPRSVVRIDSRETNLGFPRIFVDDQGRLHATWGEAEAPGGYPWQRIMYARSLDGGQTWSEPFPLAEGHQGDQNLAIYGDTIHTVWNGDAGYQGRYYRYSENGGVTWSARFTLPLPVTSGGLQGAPAIVVDSTGVAHILYTDSPRLFYIQRFPDGRWSEYAQIAGPESVASTSEINFPMLAITQGNKLHALYTRDAEAVYYQQLSLDTPLKHPQLLPDRKDIIPSNNSNHMATSDLEEDKLGSTELVSSSPPVKDLPNEFVIVLPIIVVLIFVGAVIFLSHRA